MQSTDANGGQIGQSYSYYRHPAHDLGSGEWDRRHGHLRTQPEFGGSLKLLVGR